MPVRKHLRSVALLGALMMVGTPGAGLAQAEGEVEELRREVEMLRSQVQQLLDAQAADRAPAPMTPEAEREAVRAAPMTPEAEREAVRARPDDPVTRRPSRVGVADPLDPVGIRPYRIPGISDVLGDAAFNPAISVIIDGVAFRDNRRGDSFEFIEETAGFIAGHDHGAGHGDGHGTLEPGFNLREAEIVFQASVDPYFDALVNVAVTGDGEIEVEEAYATSRGLPAGFQLKFGKFLSDIGYINRQHPHDWDFVDRPLPNELIFGEHGLLEVGAQVSWIPPTPVYTRFGVEVLQGESEGIATYLGGEEITSGAGATRTLDRRSGPRLFTGFAKVAPDLGFNHALQIGAFGGVASKYHAFEEHGSRVVDADGTSWFVGTDWVYKYSAGGYLGHGDLTLQAEYMMRELDVDLLVTPNPGTVHPGQALDGAYRLRQDGIYAQAVYGIAPRWQIGARYEGLGLTNSGFVSLDNGVVTPASLGMSHRYSGVLTFFPTEFSRFRLQYSHGDILTADGTNIVQVRDTERERFHQVFLQFIVSLGAHGAHTF